jgi:hypothetical protein
MHWEFERGVAGSVKKGNGHFGRCTEKSSTTKDAKYHEGYWWWGFPLCHLVSLVVEAFELTASQKPRRQHYGNASAAANIGR